MVLVVGPTLGYAWILARSTQPDPNQCQAFYNAAEKIGISKDQWIRLMDCGLPATLKASNIK